MSEDGEYGLTVIAFIGSVFSPYYAWARRRGAVDPTNHCAFNVAIYGPRCARWAMTERGAAQLSRGAERLTIGSSAMHWNGTTLDIDIDERCAPVPRRLRGAIRVHPAALLSHGFALDAGGSHRWTPYAPCAHVEVDFSLPGIKWSGIGYFDSNRGAEPLEDRFIDWTWSRTSVSGSTVVLYDILERNLSRHSLALEFAASGAARAIPAPAVQRLPSTGWRVSRHTRADGEHPARVVKTLEDAPFYSRSLLATRLDGLPALAVHESLNLDRFRSRWVQCLLPFRMPRITF